MAEVNQHQELVLRAEKWLKSQGCKIVLRDPMRAYTSNSEAPDAIGWRNNISILIECKVSRSDFLADQKKIFRRRPDMGMGNWRFYLCPPEIIRPEDLPNNWGLLWVYPKMIKKVHGVPKGNCSWGTLPFKANRQCELAMLLSALRRLAIRGHLKEIYEPMPMECKDELF